MKNIFSFRKEQKENPIGGMIPVSPGQAEWTPRNYEELANEGYVKNNVAFSAINLVATNCSQVKFSLFNGDTPVDSHPVLDLLNNPNPMSGRADFIYSAVAHRLLSGNSYINAVGKGIGQDGTAPSYDYLPVELWVNRPDRYKVLQGTVAPVGGYEYKLNGIAKVFPADQASGKSNVLHWKTFHPTSDYYGLSPIEAAAVGIDIYNESLEWNKAFFDNGARPSGALMWKGEGNLDDDTYSKLKKEVEEIYSGKSNNGRPMVLGQFDWKQFSLSPKDMDFIQAKDTTAKDIARAFGVPPILLNIGSDSTFANQAEARLALWEDTVIPTMGSFISELNRWLTPRYGDGLTIKADLSDIYALEIKRQRQWERAEGAAFLTINEKRSLVGYSEVEGGDDVLIGSTQIPLTFDMPENDSKASESGLEFKLLDGSRRAEKREQSIQDRLMATLERPFSKKVNIIINRYVKKMAGEYEKDPMTNPDVVLMGMTDDLRKVYDTHYRRTMQTFGSRTLDGLKSMEHMLETKAEKDVFLVGVENWIEDHGARAALVEDTTKKQIREGIKFGLAENATGAQMASIIFDKAGGAVAKSRSVVIARTETHMAAQAASVAAVDATGLDLQKVWIAAADERTRDSHLDADSDSHTEPIAKDASFQVGLDSMQAPGLGSVAEENINCRCVVSWVSPDEQ